MNIIPNEIDATEVDYLRSLDPQIESPEAEAAREERELAEPYDGPPSPEARESVRLKREQRQQTEARRQAEAAKTFDLKRGESFTLVHLGDRLKVTLTYTSSGYVGYRFQLGRCQPFCVGSGADRPGMAPGCSLSLAVGEVEVSLRSVATPGGARVTVDSDAEVIR